MPARHGHGPTKSFSNRLSVPKFHPIELPAAKHEANRAADTSWDVRRLRKSGALRSITSPLSRATINGHLCTGAPRPLLYCLRIANRTARFMPFAIRPSAKGTAAHRNQAVPSNRWLFRLHTLRTSSSSVAVEGQQRSTVPPSEAVLARPAVQRCRRRRELR